MESIDNHYYKTLKFDDFFYSVNSCETFSFQAQQRLLGTQQ